MYQHTADLLCLDFCRPGKINIAPEFASVSTPLVYDNWAAILVGHPDQAFVRYICDGIKFGFRIRFQWGSPLSSASSNMESARQHPAVISEYLQKELSMGRMLGPFTNTQTLPPLLVNRFGVIPKGHNTGKWRFTTWMITLL